MHVHKTRLPSIERNQNLIGETRIYRQRNSSRPSTWGQPFRRTAQQINAKQIVVLITAPVLEIQHVLTVALPARPMNRTCPVVGQGPVIVKA